MKTDCSFKTSYKRLNKEGEPVSVERKCSELVEYKNGLGGYYYGVCKRGHLNGNKK